MSYFNISHTISPPLPPPSHRSQMAPGWEMHGLNFTLGMQSMDYTTTPTAVATAPMYSYALPSADTLRIEDLLDFTNLELLPSSAAATNADAHYTPPPPPAAITSEYRSTDFPEEHFMPCEEAAELEWLSQFVEDSFSNNPYPPLPASTEKLQLPNYPSVTAGRSARSKRENHLMSAAWAASAAVQSTSSSTSSSSSEFPSRASSASSSRRKRGGEEGDGGARRCTHCASEKTPQWRTGPMGPKTLCNACGVRYKSGRLVPEYRPASSPTFVLTQHSNSHRKVMELRRQKEHHGIRHDGGAVDGELLYHDYEVC